MERKETEVRRRPYTPPTLTTYGSVDEITATRAPAGPNDQVGVNVYRS